MKSLSSVLTPYHVAVGDLSLALNTFERHLEDQGCLRTCRANTILFQGALSDSELDDALERFAVLQPSRFFVIRFLEQGSEPSVTLAGRCHETPAGTTVCSEVIDISFAPNDIQRITSLIEACFVPGTIRQAAAFSLTDHCDVVQQFVPIVDEVFFDSDFVAGALQLVDILPQKDHMPVDLQWIKWAFLRDAVKDVFGHADASAKLVDVDEIALSVSLSGVSRLPPSLLLLLGWILSRLNLEPLALSKRGYECQNVVTKRATIVRTDVSESPQEHEGLELSFSASGESFVSLKTVCEGENWNIQSFCFGTPSSAPHKVRVFTDSASLLKRHFHIGESLINYPQAARVAVQLRSLQRAFYSRNT